MRRPFIFDFRLPRECFYNFANALKREGGKEGRENNGNVNISSRIISLSKVTASRVSPPTSLMCEARQTETETAGGRLKTSAEFANGKWRRERERGGGKEEGRN